MGLASDVRQFPSCAQWKEGTVMYSVEEGHRSLLKASALYLKIWKQGEGGHLEVIHWLLNLSQHDLHGPICNYNLMQLQILRPASSL